MADEGAGAALLNDLMNDRQRTRCPTWVRRADTLADQGAAGAGVPIDRHEVPSILGGRLLHSRRSWSKLVLWAACGRGERGLFLDTCFVSVRFLFKKNI